ncbi:hypothetical protein RF11_11828 [Thelohanellus kitauei]|uniref:Uncharacterized protein n=1 Tax=Thelohanellus kitauei TaxID=669202 RepID=A0A0C2N999_THEKT|nr:hypothetical protein RF11_11828 [Thelohanellus kitauei]
MKITVELVNEAIECTNKKLNNDKLEEDDEKTFCRNPGAYDTMMDCLDKDLKQKTMESDRDFHYQYIQIVARGNWFWAYAYNNISHLNEKVEDYLFKLKRKFPSMDEFSRKWTDLQKDLLKQENMNVLQHLGAYCYAWSISYTVNKMLELSLEMHSALSQFIDESKRSRKDHSKLEKLKSDIIDAKMPLVKLMTLCFKLTNREKLPELLPLMKDVLHSKLTQKIKSAAVNQKPEPSTAAMKEAKIAIEKYIDLMQDTMETLEAENPMFSPNDVLKAMKHDPVTEILNKSEHALRHARHAEA